jgi:hypothetical protein
LRLKKIFLENAIIDGGWVEFLALDAVSIIKKEDRSALLPGIFFQAHKKAFQRI